MTKSNSVWVLVADAKCGRLLHCSQTELGSAHVKQADRIEPEPQAYEHGKPSPRAGRTGTTSQDHESEEETRRFARTLTNWTKQKMDDLQVPRLVLFAPPRFLGALRKVSNGHGLNGRVEQKEADLTSLTVEQLTKHRSIRSLIGVD